MKIPLPKLQLQHTILLGEMQLHSRLAKTLEHLLRHELSSVERFLSVTETKEIQLHSRLAKTLENQLRQEICTVEKCFHEMQSFSNELLNLQRRKQLENQQSEQEN